MFLHLGQNVTVPKSSVVGIFDIETSSISKITREYFKKAQKNKIVINISDELPKSYVVCEENGKHLLYISQISSATLLKRNAFMNSL